MTTHANTQTNNPLHQSKTHQPSDLQRIAAFVLRQNIYHLALAVAGIVVVLMAIYGYVRYQSYANKEDSKRYVDALIAFEKEPQEAIPPLEELTKKSSSFAFFSAMRLFSLHLEKDDLKKSESVLDRATSIAPDAVSDELVLIAKASLQSRQGNASGAIETLKNVTGPMKALAQERLGDLYLFSQKNAQAGKQAYQYALELYQAARADTTAISLKLRLFDGDTLPAGS